jgi:3-carboxy-cis,cis-muconate cycloisomerase
VPTVLGAKFAVYLAEVSRHRTRLRSNLRDVGVVSLFGAGGTSAAYGAKARLLRRAVADRLGLHSVDVPWHVARDGLATFAMGNTAMAATAARFAREVIDLSRTEIAEVAEAGGYLRGASSTMPQKSNPIDSESVIGLAASAGALSVAMLRAMEAGHERSAGEWQIEWQVLPQIVCLCSSAVLTAGIATENLQIFPDRMRENLNADGGLIMAEAYMMRLAPRIGREEAHELVYEAARQVRESNRPLLDIVRELVSDGTRRELPEVLVPESYLGDPQVTIEAALNGWHDASVTGTA